MRGLSKHTNVRTYVCCAIAGAAGLTGLIAGFAARGGGGGASPQTSGISINLSPSEAVSFRFPADWADAVAAQPAAFALAGSSTAPAMFDPQPARYVVASAGGVMPVPAHPAYAVASATAGIPVSLRQGDSAAMAAEAVPLPRPAPARSTQTASLQPAADHTAAAKAAAHAKLAAAAQKPKPESNAVLNTAQIASIKKRLNLTPDQEHYWLAVEAELRKMEYVKGTKGSKTAQIDMTKVNVQGLRDAGFPLVMSFSDDQRRELKSLAHLLGLESAMAGL